MKKQVAVIHGGHTFDTYEAYFSYLENYQIESLDYFRKGGWKEGLQEALGEDFDVLVPSMPSKQNAKYAEWEIWFRKILPYLEDGMVLVGHSLGGTFLTKYLAENTFPKKIAATCLIAAPFRVEPPEKTLADFVLPHDLSRVADQGGKIFLYYSTDDPVVPFATLEQYTGTLPNATARVFDDRGHFLQDEFPELAADIRSLGW